MSGRSAEKLVYTLIWIAVGCIVYLFIARDTAKLTKQQLNRTPQYYEGNERLHDPSTRDIQDLRKDPTPSQMPKVKKVGELRD
ncbi:MAG: hypothetical protein ACOY3I_01130 [Verrucomicrobiota bacterium]